MTEEKPCVLNFLKENPESLFARKEMARKAVKRTVYEENPHWADQALAALVTRKWSRLTAAGIIDSGNPIRPVD